MNAENNLTHEMLITMVVAISAGVMIVALSRRLNLSAIVLLMLAGVGLGPEFLNIVQPESLGDGLTVIVSLAVGLILFEFQLVHQNPFLLLILRWIRRFPDL